MLRIALICGVGLLVLGWSSDNVAAQEHKGGGEHEGHGHQEKAEGKEGHHEDSAAKEALCPVMGRPIKKNMYTMYRGKPVYVCCTGCLGRIEKDPGKYADGIKAQWDALKPLRIQVKCPGSGKPINRKHYAKGEEGPVFFCSAGCKAAWEKDSSKLKAKLDDCYTFQTHCVIMGNEINPAVSSDIDGRTVYYCCGGCDRGFKKDKEANFRKLDEQIAKNKAAFAKRHGKQDKDEEG